MKNYYEILSVESTAAPAEIKRAFREEIARYHPDKVQHLGKELQEVAATRATELTEAYRTLTNHELRAEYDRQLQAPQGGTVVERPPATPAGGAVPTPSWSTPASSSRLQPSVSGRSAQQFSEDRSHKDVFVRQATLGRVRLVAGAALGAVSEVPVRGFDLVLATAKMRLFGRGQPAPRFFVRLVRDVNPGAIRETFAMALKARGAEANEVCVLLLGKVTSQTEACQEAAALRNQPGKAVKSLFLIPVDLRDWTARLSPETPRVWRSIVENLQKAS